MDEIDDIMGAIRAARAFLGLRQDQLAAIAKVSRAMIARVEKSDPTVNGATLQKIRRALENEGIKFLSSNEDHGPAVARSKMPRKTQQAS